MSLKFQEIQGIVLQPSDLLNKCFPFRSHVSFKYQGEQFVSGPVGRCRFLNFRGLAVCTIIKVVAALWLGHVHTLLIIPCACTAFLTLVQVWIQSACYLISAHKHRCCGKILPTLTLGHASPCKHFLTFLEPAECAWVLLGWLWCK